jgi:CRISPR-associated protein Cas1
MYAMRMGEVMPAADIAVLRGIEGARMKETYRRLAQQFGIEWKGRRYDRSAPDKADDANQAINHAATAVSAAAMVAVASTGAIPQIGFIHEDSGVSLALDIADLFRDKVTLPVAFGAIGEMRRNPSISLERTVRRVATESFRKHRLIPTMIDRIKELFRADDDCGDS